MLCHRRYLNTTESSYFVQEVETLRGRRVPTICLRTKLFLHLRSRGGAAGYPCFPRKRCYIAVWKLFALPDQARRFGRPLLFWGKLF